jgi:hypothetical protein
MQTRPTGLPSSFRPSDACDGAGYMGGRSLPCALRHGDRDFAADGPFALEQLCGYAETGRFLFFGIRDKRAVEELRCAGASANAWPRRPAVQDSAVINPSSLDFAKSSSSSARHGTSPDACEFMRMMQFLSGRLRSSLCRFGVLIDAALGELGESLVGFFLLGQRRVE